MKITILSGSPRTKGLTIRVAEFLQQYLGEKYPANQYNIVSMHQHQLPFVQKVWSTINDVPAEHKELAETIFGTDAFILVTPEYNGSYSPALKNLLDHFPKQSRKAFGIVTASPGVLGGIRASQQMQNLVSALFGVASPYMLIVPSVDKKFDETGHLVEEAFLNSIKTFTTEFMWLAEGLGAAKRPA